MAFSNDVLRQALKIISDREKAAQKQYDAKCADIYSANPELSRIDTEIQIKSSKMALLIFSGDTVSAEKLHAEITELKIHKDKLFKLAKLPSSPNFSCGLCKDSGYVDGKICKCVKDLASNICYSTLIDEMPLDSSTFENFDLSY